MSKPLVGSALILVLAGLLATVPALPTAPAAPAESGTLLKADQLKAEPFRDAKAIANLAAGAKVEILQRQGGWFRVKTAKASGWVHMLSVRRGEAAKTNAAGNVGGLLALASGRAGTGKVVATTGIRGLNEEQLKAAKYSESELKLSDSLVASGAEPAQFAAGGKLAARPIAYLPAPKR